LLVPCLVADIGNETPEGGKVRNSEMLISYNIALHSRVHDLQEDCGCLCQVKNLVPSVNRFCYGETVISRLAESQPTPYAVRSIFEPNCLGKR